MPKTDKHATPKAPPPSRRATAPTREERLEELERKLARLNRETLMQLEAMVQEQIKKKN
jgi:hypothetical protein